MALDGLADLTLYRVELHGSDHTVLLQGEIASIPDHVFKVKVSYLIL